MEKEKARKEARRRLEKQAEEKAAAQTAEEQEEDRQAQSRLVDELRSANVSEAQISYFQRVHRLFGHFC